MVYSSWQAILIRQFWGTHVQFLIQVKYEFYILFHVFHRRQSDAVVRGLQHCSAPTHSLQTALQTVYMLYLFTVSQTGLWATCAISGPWQLSRKSSSETGETKCWKVSTAATVCSSHYVFCFFLCASLVCVEYIVEFVCSPCACMGSLWTLTSPRRPKTCMLG